MAKTHVTMTVNGKAVEALVEPRTLLIHFLREQLNLTGPHIGCDTSHCGACTVDLDGKSVKSCTLFAVQADPSEDEIRFGISGNLCRCTGYQNIVKAIQYAAAKLAGASVKEAAE